MKTLTIVILCLAVGFGLAWLIRPATADSSTVAEAEQHSTKQLYTCGMHPQIISDEPGLCPICNMKLTPIRDAGQAKDGTVQIDPSTRQNMGLVTAPVEMRHMSRSISTFGKVVIPEPQQYSVTVKVDGWVEKLFVDQVGARVYKGQPLLEIYSPDLVAAQREFLVAADNNNGDGALSRMAAMAETRLRNFDISDDQIEELRKSGQITRTMRLRSPADGFVLKKQVNEGDRVTAKSSLFEIADLSNVWVEAFVYEQDLAYVSLGQTTVMTTPGIPGERFQGKISYVAPVLDSRGQAEIRMTLDNTKQKLRPEMYAELTFDNSLPGKRLAIPRSAVINSGRRQLVFVADGEDGYERREVETGAVDNGDMVEVTKGLSAGEQVVTSGQFLIDSESRLNEMAGSGGSMPGMGSMPIGEAAPKETTPETTANHLASHTEHGMAMPADSTDPYNIYTCPMPAHYHVLHYGPGQCPECGMDLVPVSVTDNSPVYVCPMPQCKTAQKEPGKCPVCGMNLIEYVPTAKADSSKAVVPSDTTTLAENDPFDVHTCPMPSHYNVLKYGSGQCPECGMDLVPVAETDNAPVYVCPMPQCGSPSKEPGQCDHCGMDLVEYRPGDVSHD